MLIPINASTKTPDNLVKSEILSQLTQIAAQGCNDKTTQQPKYTTIALDTPAPQMVTMMNTLHSIHSLDSPTLRDMNSLHQPDLIQSWEAVCDQLDWLSTTHDCYIDMMNRHNLYLLMTLQQLVHVMQGFLAKIAPCKPLPQLLEPQKHKPHSGTVHINQKHCQPHCPQHHNWNLLHTDFLCPKPYPKPSPAKPGPPSTTMCYPLTPATAGAI